LLIWPGWFRHLRPGRKKVLAPRLIEKAATFHAAARRTTLVLAPAL
jgi:hypothetical protein